MEQEVANAPSERALWELGRVAYQIVQSAPTPAWDVPDYHEEPLLHLSASVSSIYFQQPEFARASQALSSDEDLAKLRSMGGERGFLVVYPGGASGESMDMLPNSLLTPALRRAKIAPPKSEAEFCQWVVENLASLKSALRDEPIDILRIHGLNRISLPPGAQISTPWGVLKGLPDGGGSAGGRMRVAPTTAVLTSRHTVRVKIEPQGDHDLEEFDDFFAQESRLYALLPLAFALGVDGEKRQAPGFTFSTSIVPFAGGYGAGSRSFWMPGSTMQVERGEISEIEEWASIIDANHNQSLDIAGRRLVSALSERYNPDDRLIDGVISWESLVGTNGETVNRVTTALAILLEHDVRARATLIKRLADTYAARSSLVHGREVKPAKRDAATKDAVETAVRALRVLYTAGEPWVSGTSEERSRRITLGEWDRRHFGD